MKIVSMVIMMVMMMTMMMTMMMVMMMMIPLERLQEGGLRKYVNIAG